MKRILLIALALVGLTAAAQAYDLTATCPYDGETAYFSGTKITLNGTACNYKHTHYDRDTHSSVTHSYWVPCGD
jgi:opacity protein-like surface antigen